MDFKSVDTTSMDLPLLPFSFTTESFSLSKPEMGGVPHWEPIQPFLQIYPILTLSHFVTTAFTLQ
jgi:hypothetical protein